MTGPDLALPILVFARDYILPVSAKRYGLFGELQFEKVRFADWRMVDASGQEWFVDQARKEGYANPLYRLLPRRYRLIRATFTLRKGRQYDLQTLIDEVSGFLLSRKLKGQPFANKAEEIPRYLEQFESVSDLVSRLGYFDARPRH